MHAETLGDAVELIMIPNVARTPPQGWLWWAVRVSISPPWGSESWTAHLPGGMGSWICPSRPPLHECSPRQSSGQVSKYRLGCTCGAQSKWLSPGGIDGCRKEGFESFSSPRAMWAPKWWGASSSTPTSNWSASTATRPTRSAVTPARSSAWHRSGSTATGDVADVFRAEARRRELQRRLAGHRPVLHAARCRHQRRDHVRLDHRATTAIGTIPIPPGGSPPNSSKLRVGAGGRRSTGRA